MIWCCSNYTSAEGVHETDTAEVILRSSPPRVSSRRTEASGITGDEASGDQLFTPEASEAGEDASEAQPPPQGEEPEDAGEGPFMVTLEMTPGERLGALLDVLDMKTLRVVEVRQEGRLRLHNASVAENKKVRPGYYIVGVNGKSGRVEEMVEELRRSRTWHLRIARKQEITVSLEKSGPLCMDLQFEPESDCIVIRRVGEGVVKAHNDRADDDDQRVRAGDRIISVNDTEAPARTLLEAIRGNTDLTMKIGRPHLPRPAAELPS